LTVIKYNLLWLHVIGLFAAVDTSKKSNLVYFLYFKHKSCCKNS